MLLVFPVGLELVTGWRAGEAQAPVPRKRAKLIKGLEKPFDSLVLQSEPHCSEVVFRILVTQNTSAAGKSESASRLPGL